jgi:hypothetical protein
MTQFNLNETKPIHSRVDRNRPKPVNTFAQVLCEILYRATPFDVLDNSCKKYYIRLGDVVAIVTARITSNFDQAPMYDIEDIVFGCESYGANCPDCGTETFDNITYG